MRTLPEARVFTRIDLRACGWSDAAISRAVRSGRLLCLRRGQFASADEDPADARLLAIAAVNGCGDGVVSHRSALLLHDLPLVGLAPPVPEVTVPPRRIGGLADAHLYRATLRDEDVTTVAGAPVTSLARTIVDVARHRPATCAVAAADAALHRKLLSQAQLDDVMLACWVWPRIRRALRALALTDALAESPLESVSRLVLRWMHLPPPMLQAEIRDQFGRFVARVDFYWPEFGVVGEADGAMKYTDRTVLVAEKHRQEALEELGLIVVRWSWDDVVHRSRLLQTRLIRAFERAQLRDRSGFRPGWSVSAA
jgi:very-short-patch-repair endonuclease